MKNEKDGNSSAINMPTATENMIMPPTRRKCLGFSGFLAIKSPHRHYITAFAKKFMTWPLCKLPEEGRR